MARDVFFTVDGGPAGPLQQIRTPLGTPSAPRPPPALGQHTAEVLAEYGVSDAAWK
jgi:crotonobetainyl-CoA:carnitine CoA-transferase CaiB-like acyl-CoA transferase